VRNRHCGWKQGTVKQQMRKRRNKRKQDEDTEDEGGVLVSIDK
jgi:hypothetical protein